MPPARHSALEKSDSMGISNRFFDSPVNICRNSVKINGLDRSDKTFARRAVFFGFSATAPKKLHSMRCAAFWTDTLDCKTVTTMVAAGVTTLQLIRQTGAIADYRHFYISP